MLFCLLWLFFTEVWLLYNICKLVLLLRAIQCCDPIDYSPLMLPVHGFSGKNILQWAAISFLGDLLTHGIKPESPAWVIFITEPPREAHM